MYRFVARASQVVTDFFVLSAAYWLAFLFRFELQPHFSAYKLLFFTWPYVVVLQYLALVLFGVPRFAWRYIGLREAYTVALAAAASSTVLAGIRLGLEPLGGYTKFLMIPLGVIAMDCALAFLGITGVRVLRRILAERTEAQSRRDRRVEQVPTLLIGAGQAGVMTAKEIAARPDLGIEPAGFVDDDPLKQRSVIHGIPVIGATEQIPALARELGVSQALITIANAPGSAIRRITLLCKEAGLDTKIIPGLYEIVGGHVNLSRIRTVAIEDLLGRDPVDLDVEAISGVVRGRDVMVTGAGGSIGSELCRQICRFGPASLILVEQAENALFNIHRELRCLDTEALLVPCIADVCDAQRMGALFAQHRPAVVFHAAAHKHVPMMEWNPGEALKNNVLGTRLVADLAHAHGVAEFVMISTDKAVNPTSVMGASKRVAEMYCQALSQQSETRFVTVRFGNVLGSAGSVIPIFQEQIAGGGPVTVTHPEMKRYFMTIPEACQLVLQAASMGRGGEIFVLDMGAPVKIVDLAHDLIRLSGLKPGEDVDIQFTGLRPGEKLFEEIALNEEHADKTRHPKIFVGRVPPQDPDAMRRHLEALRQAAESGDGELMRRRIRAVVPEYRGGEGAAAVSRPAARVLDPVS